jgi:hypothetical protein
LISAGAYIAVRFELSTPVVAEDFGLLTRANALVPQGPILGALIRLTGPTDVPDSINPLDTPDVLARILITPDYDLANIAGGIEPTRLDPGYYAILFGSGQFGATGSAYGVGGDRIDDSSFFFWAAAFPDGYHEISDSGAYPRVFLRGEPLPEPGAAAAILSLGVIGLARPYHRRHPRRAAFV